MQQWTENLIMPDKAVTLAGLFAHRVERSGDRLAYRYFDRESKGWLEYTWQQMGEQIGRWQTALAKEGLSPGDRVAVLLRNSPEWIMFDQAALGLELVTVPLYTDDRPDNVAYILEDSAVKLVLVQDAGRWKRLAPTLEENTVLQRVLVLDPGSDVEKLCEQDERVRVIDRWLPETGQFKQLGRDPHELASIVYTSGTTGRSKGVMLSHYNMLSVTHSGLTMIDVFEEDMFLSFLPLSHTLERTVGYYLPVMTGSSVAFSRSVAQLAEDLATQKPTILVAVPRIFERVYGRIKDQMTKKPAVARFLFNAAVKVGWRRFERGQGRAGWRPSQLFWPLLRKLVSSKILEKLGGRLRFAVSGGAPLSPEIAQVFIGLGLPILQGYGLTETSPMISVNTLEDNVPDSVGIPMRGIEVRVGENDELLALSPGIMLGYWNNHAATAKMIDSDGWLHTGDQVRIDNNHIFITGRLKDILVLSNGEKVPPGDMELAIALDTMVEQVMVVGEGKPFLSALVVLNADHWPGLAQDCGVDLMSRDSLHHPKVMADISRRIKQSLTDFPGYAKIRRVTLLLEPWTVDNGLLTPTLKVKRPKVQEHYAKEVSAMYQESGKG